MKNMDKSTRQQLSANKLKEDLNKYKKVVLEAYPGWGKTRLINDHFITPSFENIKDCSFEVLVDSDYLLKQWNERKANKQVVVETWQKRSRKNEKIKKVHFLVIDEVHKLINTKRYIKVFEKYEAKWIIALTGTLDITHKQNLTQKGFVISDVVSEEEGFQNGWLKRRFEYNLPVQLNYEDSVTYRKLTDMYEKRLRYLNPLIEDVESGTGTANFNVLRKVISKNGINYNFAKTLAEKRRTSESTIIGCAVNAIRLKARREELIYNNVAKLEVIEKLFKKYEDRKIITFSLRQDFADMISNIKGNSYHGASLNNAKIISDFETSEKGILNTVGKISEGADIDGVSVVINAAYFSKWVRKKQQDSRARGKVNTDTLVFNLFCVLNEAFNYEPTFEKWFLLAAQKNSSAKIITTNLNDYEQNVI